MSYDWRQFLDLAEVVYHLKTDAVDDETRYRTAISRAYYATSGAARTTLDGKQLDGMTLAVRNTAADHQLLPQQLKSLSPPAPRMALRLEQLRHRRNSADYDDSYGEPDLRASAQSSLALADMLLDWLDSLP